MTELVATPRMAATVLVLAPLENTTHGSLSSCDVASHQDFLRKRGSRGGSGGHSGQGAVGLPEQQYRVLFVKRHAKAGFMASRYVFPGGVVEAFDGDQRWRRAVAGSDCEACEFGFGDAIRTHRSAADADASQAGEHVAYRVGGLRELFEETGMLLASDNDNQKNSNVKCSLVTRFDDAAHVEREREAVCDDATRFLSLCERLGVSPSVKSLQLWSRWITPPFEKRRYDTFFYIAPLRDDAEIPDYIQHDGKETVHTAWYTPKDALDLALAGKILLAPPTMYTLVELAQYATIDAVVRAAQQRAKSAAQPILPATTRDERGFSIALPGDYTHSSSSPADVAAKRLNRVLLSSDDKRWHVIRSSSASMSNSKL
eukprot:TRINITY_DN59184_c0_g1_i1.p1 TRINITY_DN59184_c0_g1~~TRINITY_DN59184_c0_g1_i1.p1  ORF type:complete len:383 (+),score=145.63 TRINITY_DN59184_c0_g1_i1:35-1150(+)